MPDNRGEILLNDTIVKDADTAGLRSGAVWGDFNGDGIKDYMWLEGPEFVNNDREEGCVGSCDSYIRFSDPDIPSIKIENCIGGIPDNLGDLNMNGRDEVGLNPHWFTSCWRSYYVWTLINNEWIYAVEPISTHCIQWENGEFPIEIDKENKGNVIIRYSDWINDHSDLVTLTKSVKIVQ